MTKSNYSLVRCTRNPYRMVASPEVQHVYAFRCECGELIHKRVDSFVVGLHVIICVRCDNQSTEVIMPDGEILRVTDEAHRSTGM